MSAPAEPSGDHADHGAALVVDALSKAYDGEPALDAVSISVPAGEIHGLLGPNGSGKSTLMAILMGLIRADSGSVSLLDRPLRTGAGLPAEMAGFVDTPRFPPALTAAEVLAMAADLDGTRGASTQASAEDLLETVGLTAAADRPTRGFSLGMRQRLALAVAMLRRPRLLVLDEPANGLDPAGLRDLLTLIRGLADDGTAVLISSHDVGTLASLCDAATILAHGRTVFSGALAALEDDAPKPRLQLHTSDDAAAISMASDHASVEVEPDGREDGFTLLAGPEECDSFVIELGRAGIAVRTLDLRMTALESAFFALTGASPDDPGPEAPDDHDHRGLTASVSSWARFGARRRESR